MTSISNGHDGEERAPALQHDFVGHTVTPEHRLIGLIVKHRVPAADIQLKPEHFHDPDLRYTWKRWERLGSEVDQLDEDAIRARTGQWARFAVWLIDEAGASDSDNPTNPETEIAALAEQIRGREPPPPPAATDAVEILPPVPALLRRPNGGATDIESMPPRSDPPEPNAQPQANGGSIEQPAGDDNSIQLERQAPPPQADDDDRTSGDDDLPELPHPIREGITRWWRNMHYRKGPAAGVLRLAAQDLFRLLKVNAMVYPHLQDASHQAVVDSLREIGRLGDILDDEAQRIMGECRQAADDPASDAGRQRARARAAGEHEDAGKADEPKSDATSLDPCPLPETLLPVAPFDFDLLPEKLRAWGADVAERMQCPPDFVAVSGMAALGSILGRKVAIRPKIEDDWQENPNQWALVIGRPGVLKSPAMEEALRPVKKLEAKAERDFKDAQGTHALDEQIAALQAKEVLKRAAKLINEKSSSSEKVQKARDLLAESPTSSEPTRHRYITNDTNIASLGVLLQQNPNGLLVFRDEIVSLLRGLDQEERASERGFYLTGWNGNSSYTFDRIGRGLHLTIESVCLSMLGSAQPGTIADYLAQAIRGGRGADGLMQRFGLLVWPDISPDWKFVDRWPNKRAREANFEVFNYFDQLDWHAVNAKRDIGSDGDEEGVPFLRFNIDAYEAFVIWLADLERRLRGPDLHHALESHLAKYRKLVPALALICHLADGGIGPVGVHALERAILWARYLETHASRAYGSTKTVEAATAKAILAKLHSGHLKSPFSSRDVWRPGWSQLTDSAAVQAGLKMLSDYDWLTQRKVATAGRDATIYMVNPKAMKMYPGG